MCSEGRGSINKCGSWCGNLSTSLLVGRAAWQGPGGVALLEEEVTKLTRGGLWASQFALCFVFVVQDVSSRLLLQQLCLLPAIHHHGPSPLEWLLTINYCRNCFGHCVLITVMVTNAITQRHHTVLN